MYCFLFLILFFIIVFCYSTIRGKQRKKYEEIRPIAEKCVADFAKLKCDYIPYSTQQSFLSLYNKIEPELKSVRGSLAAEDKEVADNAVTAINYIKNEVVQHNIDFVKAEKIACSSLFSNIAGHSLDDQQQTAIVTNQDHNLVLAGAGSGKTLTITGKVKYLCERKNISSDDILLIAFTRKAAEEMTERIKKMGISLEAMTFHKLGLGIISKARKQRPDVMDEASFRRFLEDFFKDKIIGNKEIVKSLIQYFAYYLHIPADLEKFDSIGAAYEHERSTDFETLKSRYIYNKASSFAAESRTLQGETVHSIEEIIIANFLFLHGVRYEYERVYPYPSHDPYRKMYRPDFYLIDYDIYLEHFGINKDGKTPWLSQVAEKKYLDEMHWKRSEHQANNTKLIETYSWYTSEGILIPKLKSTLTQCGVVLKEIDYTQLYNQIYNDVSDRHFREFISLCGTFITLFKSNGYDLPDLDNLTYSNKQYNTEYHMERMRLFKSIIRPILIDYQKKLKTTSQVDFSDMIITATQLVESGTTVHPYQYVIIDEFQDISLSRYRLIKAIIEQTGAHLLCVGDDWQSIYRFSGSDLGVLINFEESFGASEIMRIEKTYRNSQQLIDSAASFVMKNPAQIRKSLKSNKSLQPPIVFWYYEGKPYDAIKVAVDTIIKDHGTSKSILFLGRTKYDEEALIESALFSKNRDKLVYKYNPSVDISFMTVHKAKGLESDNVIILNFNNKLLGFPNKIADDPILELVLSSSDTFLYGEERRLLYVALTRTRNSVHLIAEKSKASEFAHEFETDVNTRHCIINANDFKSMHCPTCKTGWLVAQTNRKTNESFVGCTNYPQCNYTLKDVNLLRNAVRCHCGGFMVSRIGRYGRFYGCSNYPYCRGSMNEWEYEEALSYI